MSEAPNWKKRNYVLVGKRRKLKRRGGLFASERGKVRATWSPIRSSQLRSPGEFLAARLKSRRTPPKLVHIVIGKNEVIYSGDGVSCDFRVAMNVSKKGCRHRSIGGSGDRTQLKSEPQNLKDLRRSIAKAQVYFASSSHEAKIMTRLAITVAVSLRDVVHTAAPLSMPRLERKNPFFPTNGFVHGASSPMPMRGKNSIPAVNLFTMSKT
ncbi:hypothetical protein VNO77_02296 [Canavalia gladiata]|uniref:Uncharacterized protein n=1 Tax=Canavalia gladiata TaxID=3824 RepID=A0AAN9MTD8_CANGL